MKLSDWLKSSDKRACDLARAVGTTEATISRLKHGHSQPSFDLARRIAEATGGAVTANDFMEGKSPIKALPFASTAARSLQGAQILLVIGGGIAAYKCLDLIRRLKERGAGVRAIVTQAGQQFVTPLSVSVLAEEKAYTELFDLKDEAEIGHIQLARDANLIVVAPATANLLAKMASGQADDLAGAVLLATRTPVLAAPAMNVRMWEHPATRRNLQRLAEDGVKFVGPNEGDMACGEFGFGRMSEVPEIIATIEATLGAGTERPLEGAHVLVTSGPTHEPLDPVRYIANRSSGRQGHAIAQAAKRLGARVTLVSGPTDLSDPEGISTRHVETADQMLAEVEAALPADIAVCAAAVADWKPRQEAGDKLKKADNGSAPRLQLIENPDILATLSKAGTDRPRLVIGFAAETRDVVANARDKRRAKGCDWIVANDVSEETGVMGGVHNQIHLVTGDGIEDWPEMAKEDVADALIQRAAEHLTGVVQAAE